MYELPLSDGAIQGEMDLSPERTLRDSRTLSCEVCHSAVDHSNPVGIVIGVDRNRKITGPYEVHFWKGTRASKATLCSLQSFVALVTMCQCPGLIEEAYTEYSTSPAKDMGLTCQDCHMGSVPGTVSERPVEPIAVVEGKVYPDRERSSHRFIGPDYSF